MIEDRNQYQIDNENRVKHGAGKSFGLFILALVLAAITTVIINLGA